MIFGVIILIFVGLVLVRHYLIGPILPRRKHVNEVSEEIIEIDENGVVSTGKAPMQLKSIVLRDPDGTYD